MNFPRRVFLGLKKLPQGMQSEYVDQDLPTSFFNLIFCAVGNSFGYDNSSFGQI